MRRISKAWPPKDVVQAEQQFLTDLPSKIDPPQYARNEFDKLDKPKIRQVLYAEQRAICIFCEQRVTEGANPPRIDHWRPLSRTPELALNWKNLHLSCTREGTCDKSKHEHRLVWDDADADLPWPSDMPYEDCIGFTKDGRAYVRADAPLDEAQRRALELAIDPCNDGPRKRKPILNLNDAALIRARQAAIDSERTRLGRDFGAVHASKEERQDRAAKMLSQRTYEPFVSARVAWLRNLLGKNKPPSKS